LRHLNQKCNQFYRAQAQYFKERVKHIFEQQNLMPDSYSEQEGKTARSSRNIIKSVRLDADTSVLLVNMPKDEKAYPLGK